MERSGLRSKRVIVTVAIILCMVIAIWTFFYLKRPTKLKDLAYNVNRRYGYTIYIEEEAGYTPYLVLTDNYEGDGTVLLLRKYVLDEYQPFNSGDKATAYYEDSHIDNYLNTTFLAELGDEIMNMVVESDVKIQDYSVWTGGGPRGEPDVKTIQRQIFLLSYVELEPGVIGSRPLDGEPLKYFKDDMDRIVAADEKGEPVIWMLRSALTDEDMVNMVVTQDLRVSVSSIYDSVGVRPAFCLNREMEIVEDNMIKEGLNMYVLKIPE